MFNFIIGTKENPIYHLAKSLNLIDMNKSIIKLRRETQYFLLVL
jgi:hypothetical protein